MSAPCTCGACRARRRRAPLLLIALGVVWLLSTTGVWSGMAAVGAWFLALGGLGLAIALAPGEAGHAGGGLFGALLVAAFGALLIWHAHLPHLGPWMARYWPVLLILWGLARLAEHFTGRERMRGLTAGDIFLILLIVLGGLAVAQWYRMQPLLDQWGARNHFEHSWPGFHWPGSYDFSRAAETAIGPGQRVVVQSPHGDVTLAASADAQMHAQARYEVQGPNADAARIGFERAPLQIERQGATWVVQPAGGSNDAAVRADLRLTLPAGTPVEIDAGDGDVSVAGWNAPLTLTARQGDLTVNGGGAVTADAPHGDVTLRNLAGAVRLEGGGDGDVAIAGVQGNVTLQGDYSGDVTLRGIHGAVQYGSSRLELAAGDVPGSIHFNLDELTAQRVAALRVHTRDQAVTGRELSGDASVVTAGEAVHLGFAEPPQGTVEVGTSDADITLSLPAASSFQLSAHAVRGEVTGDWVTRSTRRGNTSDAEVTVGNGTGASLRLATTNGNITVSRAR